MGHVTQTTASYEADVAACRSLLSNGSKTFYAASFLLPKRIRNPASALYAFCRLADDAIDCGGDTEANLAALRERLERAYAGRPDNIAADRAFAETVARFDIPRALPAALLDGFAWDASGRIYDDASALKSYAARVAGTVGAMMALLMDARSAHDLARATDLGTAMQLTNIARDVGEDARNGRLYLPRDWMMDAGLDPDAWLAAPEFSDKLGSVIEAVLQVATALYKRAEAGIADLPADCRPGIYAARYMYAEIGREVKRQGFDSVTRRAVVSKRRKMALLTKSVIAAGIKPALWHEGLVEENAFLIDAVEAIPPPMPTIAPHAHRAIRWWDLRGHALLLIDVLEHVERRKLAVGQPRAQVGVRSPGSNTEVLS